MLIKVDLEKAYDRISWSFICGTTLELVGLPNTWVRNIIKCVDIIKMSIVWNGKKLAWLKPTRGICEGDEISLYPFVLCMKRLGLIINYVVAIEKWKPIRLSRNGPLLFFFFFFFCR